MVDTIDTIDANSLLYKDLRKSQTSGAISVPVCKSNGDRLSFQTSFGLHDKLLTNFKTGKQVTEKIFKIFGFEIDALTALDHLALRLQEAHFNETLVIISIHARVCFFFTNQNGPSQVETPDAPRLFRFLCIPNQHSRRIKRHSKC